MQRKIQRVCRQTPKPTDNRLNRKSQQYRQHIQQLHLDDAGKNIGDGVCKQIRQALRIKRFPDAVHADFIGIIGSIQKYTDNDVACTNGDIHCPHIRQLNCRRILRKPHHQHHCRYERKMQDIHCPHFQ